MYGLPLGTCDGKLLISLKGFISGAVVGKFAVFLPESLLGLVVGIVIIFNKGNVLVFWDKKVLGRKLGDLVGL